MRNFLIPKLIKRYIAIYKEKGFNGFIKEVGWKVFALVFIFYLILSNQFINLLSKLIFSNNFYSLYIITIFLSGDCRLKMLVNIKVCRAGRA